MLAGAILCAVFGLACLVYGFVDGAMDIGLLIAYHLAAGVLGVVSATLFLIWTCQKLFV